MAISAAAREEYRRKAMRAVLEHIRDFPQEVMAWQKHSDQVQGLQRLATAKQLENPGSQGSEYTTTHTGTTLRALVQRCLNSSAQAPKPQLSSLFSRGIAVLEDQTLALYGLMTVERNSSYGAVNHEDGHIVETGRVVSQVLTRPMTNKQVSKRKSDEMSAIESSSSLSSLTSKSEDSSAQMDKRPRRSQELPSTEDSRARHDLSNSSTPSNPEKSDSQLGLKTTSTGSDNGGRFVDTRRPRTAGVSFENLKSSVQSVMSNIVSASAILTDGAKFLPLAQPDESLKVLLLKSFGSTAWFDKFLALQESSKVPPEDMMASLIAGWIHASILEVKPAWVEGSNALSRPGTVWPYVSAILSEKAVNLNEVLNEAYLQLLDDSDFQNLELESQVIKLTDLLTASILPQINALQRDKDLETKTRCRSERWRQHLRDAVKDSLILRAKIEATVEFEVQWLWFPNGTSYDAATMEALYQPTLKIPCDVVGITCMPGATLERDGDRRRIVKRAVIVGQPQQPS